MGCYSSWFANNRLVFVYQLLFSPFLRRQRYSLVWTRRRAVGWWCGCGRVGGGERGGGVGGGSVGWHDTLCMYEGFFIELSAMYVIGWVHKWGCVILPRVSHAAGPALSLPPLSLSLSLAAELGWAAIPHLMVRFHSEQDEMLGITWRNIGAAFFTDDS